MLNVDGIFVPTDWQAVSIYAPDVIEWKGKMRPLDKALLTARGPGKTTAAIAVAWRWCRDYPGIPVLFLKQERKSLADVLKMAALYYPSCDAGVSFNRSTQLFVFSNGSTILFEGLQDLSSYATGLQGMNIGALVIEELGSFIDFTLVDLVISGLRGKRWPRCVWYLSNPGGKAHGVTYDRFLASDPAHGEIIETNNGRLCAVFGGTYQDNPHLDESYPDTLRSATRHDPMKQKMWLHNSWSLLGGSMFAHVFSDDNIVQWWPTEDFYTRNDWTFFLGYDDGQASPAWSGIFAEAKKTTRGPDDLIYRKDSIVCISEVSTALADDRTKGDHSTANEIADRIKEMCAYWYKARCFGYGEPMIWKDTGHESSIGDIFRRRGIIIEPARDRDRVRGWTVVKQWMANAQPPGRRHDGDPAFYVNRRHCPQLIWEIQNAMPSHKKLDDTDSRDDALDGVRYLITTRTKKEPAVTSTSLQR